MLVEYVDAEEKDDLKIFYINEGAVFTTKVFRTYSLHLLYSVETKDVGWYIYISSNEKSIAYKLTFQDPSKTLTDEEINKAQTPWRFRFIYFVALSVLNGINIVVVNDAADLALASRADKLFSVYRLIEANGLTA